MVMLSFLLTFIDKHRNLVLGFVLVCSMLKNMVLDAALAPAAAHPRPTPVGFPSVPASPLPRLPSLLSVPIGCRSFTATSTATSFPSSWSICCQTTSPSPRAPSCWVSGYLVLAGRTEACTPEPLDRLQIQPPPSWCPGGRGQNLHRRCTSSPQPHPHSVFQRQGGSFCEFEWVGLPSWWSSW